MKYKCNQPFNSFYLQIGLYFSMIFILACKKPSTNFFDAAEQARKDEVTIKSYLDKNGISAIRTTTGLYYIIDSANASGALADTGNRLFVRYRGMFLDSARRVFDSNLSKAVDFDFELGRGQVIRGWDEGLTYFRKGEKGRIFIPSGLAYGSRGSSGIPGNTCIQFEIKLNNIEQ